ncbi:hypothetical protein JKP88DRAFT_324947 [Tribonema minus]|uniref:Methyltransferase FkbM domain-containing protein n=1 Tax=Tribonema minus TaxID=303371 RepID=A0A836CCM2_9STRA|nr:hypothetical protein JKP88DRAFT_324947 [Tribonema minus]
MITIAMTTIALIASTLVHHRQHQLLLCDVMMGGQRRRARTAPWARACLLAVAAAPAGVMAGTLDDLSPAWLSQCTGVYFDIGTNVGVQIRKLYEPHLYPGAPVLSLFDETFGKRRDGVCAIGIEPNPDHAPRLKALEKAYAARGWKVVVLTSAAASNAHGQLQFTHEGANPVRGDGTRDKELSNRASAFGSRIPGGSSYTVQGIDLPHLVKTVTHRVRRHHADSGGSSADADAPKLAMKMDIEGGEEIVIPALVVSGALCELDVAFIEFHGFFGAVPTPTNINFEDQLPKLVGSYPHCRVRIVAMDDETYYDDEQPLPHVSAGLLRA